MALTRSMMAAYINTTPSGTSETWKLIGDGFSDLSISYNSDTDTQQYINADTASTIFKGYKPEMSLEGYFEATSSSTTSGDVTSTTYTLNPVTAYLENMRLSRSTGTAAETYIVLVDLFSGTETGTGTSKTWTGCNAEKQKVTIYFSDYGGSGSDPLKITCSAGYIGDAILGTATVTGTNAAKDTLTFTAS